MQKRMVIATGGTGGHLFPAQALADEWEGELLFVGGGLAKNPFFAKNTYPYQEISCQTRVDLLRGILQSRRLLKKFSPDIVVGFGSFYSFPTLAAAKLARLPLVLHEANAWPGKVNRLFSRWATTAIHFPVTAQKLRGPAVEVEMPVRHRRSSLTAQEARQYFGLEPDRFTLLAFGGSQGANILLNPMVEAAAFLDAQVIHLTGGASDPGYSVPAYVAAFENRMDMAWAAADVSVTRAGASTLVEQVEWEVPGVLIPWPGAKENHQSANASAMVEIGGACRIDERTLSGTTLARAIEGMDQQGIKESLKQFKQRPRRRLIDTCTSLV